MADFFRDLEPEKAFELQSLSRLAYDLREARAGLLRFHDVDDEEGLLARITRGELPEHPAYEHYLAARVLEQTRQAAREGLAGREPPAILHLLLKARIGEHFAGRLAGDPFLTQDALVVPLPAGRVLTARVAAPREYAFTWQRGEEASTAEGIDTAPVHSGIAVHRHHADGRVVADTLTDPAADPADNLCAVIDLLLSMP